MGIERRSFSIIDDPGTPTPVDGVFVLPNDTAEHTLFKVDASRDVPYSYNAAR